MTKVGRNEPCPCGSGRKFKKCCGALNRPRPASPAGDTAVSQGLRHLLGRETAPDPALGMALIEKAALAGDARGAALAATIASCFFWRNRDWDVAFDYLARAAGLGHEPSRSSLKILAGGPAGDIAVEGEDWAGMRKRIDLAAWLEPPPVETIRQSPRMQVIRHFASPAACDWLIARARGRLARSTIYDKATGGTTEDGRRTNSECELDIESCGVLTFVFRARIGEIAKRHDTAMEVPKVLHYSPGETFARHFDYLDPKQPAYAAQLANRGQRTDTFLIYLNDDFEGGETHFPLIGVSNKGARGDAFLFSNVDAAGEPDENTMHIGMPPTSGEKWLFSQWIREFPK